jgi:(p)ppGpp synthase/HD superfamily hydrolase
MPDRLLGLSIRFERALRLAASGHAGQVRKGSGVPYIQHPMGVALILARAGFDEDVVIAGLLHDLVEDTEVTLDQIRNGFGDRVAEIVGFCSEVKHDAEGKKRPWLDRKCDHLAEVVHAGDDVRAVVLADKLHNLISIKLDLLDGIPVWDTFNAGKDQVLWYHRAMIDACRSDDGRLTELKDECSAMLAEVSHL